ncbi:hypothetical protein RJ639_025159 [Escallonia herrerae]|nr:hypothetical protein RJ639_025159 [Escallonia herrerae]
MGFSNVTPNEFTFSTNFKACSFLGVLTNGMQIHGLCGKMGFEWFPVVGNSIIDMYSRCGRISEAARMFSIMPLRSLISWNAMIAGYALEGMGDECLFLFQEMQMQGEVPDEFTFTSMLKACTGLEAVREGTQIHAFLIAKGFPLSVQTIVSGALIDLYVKCGYLTEAQKVFNQVEQKSVVSWMVLILGYAHEGNPSEAMDLFRQLRKSSLRVDGFVLSSVMAAATRSSEGLEELQSSHGDDVGGNRDGDQLRTQGRRPPRIKVQKKTTTGGEV